ncbi:MAG: aminotransferase class I/II-fold pyridoxal phosphate-dependent enzyme [Clostridiales bacterium]|nr:aminotransferase class I/II-fold pyridoxal phosphate-dependent enzyme [Clostridiales bacterium]
MSKKANKFREYDVSTQAVHTGTDYDEGTGAVRRPLHMANSYKLPDDLSQVNYSSTDLLMYSRNGNANQHWLEEKVAALYGADDAIVLASGVGALHALFWTLLQSGDRVVYPKVSYMAVYRMFHERVFIRMAAQDITAATPGFLFGISLDLTVLRRLPHVFPEELLNCP